AAPGARHPPPPQTSQKFLILAPFGFDGLYGLVRARLLCEPTSGHLFLFSNARRNRLKILYWDGSGLCNCAKRLERGRFSWPSVSSEAETKVLLSHEEL